MPPSLIDPDNETTVADGRKAFPNAGVEFAPGEPESALMTALIGELQQVNTTIDAIYNERYIETATGDRLDRLGAPVGVERKTGETDAKFRDRVRAGYLIAISDGSFEAIAKVAVALLDADPGQVTLEGPPATDGGAARIEVADELVNNSPLTLSEISDELTRAAVLGHRVEVLTTDTFRLGESGAQGLSNGGLI
jgi:uncharacterized phage protein gp47/JayE